MENSNNIILSLLDRSLIRSVRRRKGGLYLDRRGGRIYRGAHVYDTADIFRASSFLDNRKESLKILDGPEECYYDIAAAAVHLVEEVISPREGA